MPGDQKERQKKLHHNLIKINLRAILVNGSVNRNYLSGFTGTDCILLITLDQSYFITDFRYTQQAKKQITGFRIIERSSTKSALQTAIELCTGLRIRKLGFESEHITHAEFQNIKKWGGEINFYPTRRLVEEIRLVKDKDEISLIAKSRTIAMKAFEFALTEIKPGIKENKIAFLFEKKAKELGADSIAFDTIVASGWRSALPHGVASAKKIKKGDLIVFDFGTVYKGYHSDCTRTLVLGKPNPKQMEIYQIVKEAQQKALESIKPGISCESVDAVARTIIEKAGYGKYFGHGLGHGVGREIHEGPRLAPESKIILKPGMVVTVEPGIYLSGFGGIRIEDLVVVTENGYRVLTRFTKELISL